MDQATATLRSAHSATVAAQAQLEKAKADLTAARAREKNAEAIAAKDLANEINAKAQWERRKIGLRQGVGAKTRDILSQFLVESVTLSIAGGCAGVILGIVASIVISRLASWNTVVSVGAVALAVFFSALVGISFGYYPARKAAYLDPIEALRSK